MTTRAAVVAKALRYNGLNNGTNFPGPLNVFETELGFGAVLWCAIFCSADFKMTALPLPSMQEGMATGFAGCEEGWQYAVDHGATVASWEAQPADLVIFSFGTDSPQHVEMVTDYANGWLWTIGGDSGGSNVDGYTGEGGVHRHVWSVPSGVGNSQILGVIATGALVKFTQPQEADMIIEATGATVGYVTGGSYWLLGHDRTGQYLRKIDTTAIAMLKAEGLGTITETTAVVSAWRNSIVAATVS